MGRIGVSYARKIGIWRMHYTQLESVKHTQIIYTQTDENGLRTYMLLTYFVAQFVLNTVFLEFSH